MKTQLTLKESAKLIELGVSPEMASEIYIDAGEHGKFSISKATSMMLECAHEAKVITPIFTLADIIDILPKENDGSNLYMEYDCEFKPWWIGYNIRHLESTPELIDALYSLLVWCLEKGYVK